MIKIESLKAGDVLYDVHSESGHCCAQEGS